MTDLIAPAPPEREERWVAPAPVAPPSAREFRQGFSRLSEVLGLTPAGWTALLVAALAAAVGFWAGWLELKVVAVMALLLVGAALLFTIGRPRLEVLLRLASARVVAGERAEGQLFVRNAATRRTLPSRLDLPVGPQAASFSIPSLAGHAAHAESFVIPTERRGVIALGPAQSVQGDPFALAGRSARWTEVTELFVHPRTVNLPGRQTGFVHDLEGHASNQLTASDMSFHALREYAPGDDRRHIHWRSSARTGQLMVRQFEETRQSRVVVALDTATSSYLDGDEFELAVSALGSAALQCLREENPLALMTLDEVLPAVSPLRTLDELSRVELGVRGGVFELVQAVIHREPGASIVMLATGSAAGIDRVRRAVSSFDVDTRVIAMIADADATLSVRTVANVSLLRLPTLDDLPRAMRRAMQ
ncbi:DUF58 domain-containing protein [Aestuariimicrobium ganziense]|uniref:DUF58 domain-containing protein n=1 Tax=Aestuariimicrobium ganziense TaxID=2773677 RepID=UPI001942CDF5|nr:DUF58 domain-containing protein [Aestuariimicrobium ganziense]